MKQYCEELVSYNKVHRLIGNVSCETLLSEARAAIQNSEPEIGAYTTMLDVGAGCGVLGYAWLESSLDRRVILVEPDRKAVAFLMSFFASVDRAKVIACRLEDLTVDQLPASNASISKMFFATRAFSSSRPLEELYRLCALNLPLFSFEAAGESFYLAKKFSKS